MSLLKYKKPGVYYFLYGRLVHFSFVVSYSDKKFNQDKLITLKSSSTRDYTVDGRIIRVSDGWSHHLS